MVLPTFSAEVRLEFPLCCFWDKNTVNISKALHGFFIMKNTLKGEAKMCITES